ncbi:MAG: MaoC family dehydratase [Dehalococcoidia bacterium]|nr:MaoC family dehydratase [Dehalococcoidia bacterium]
MTVKPGWQGRFFEDFAVGDIYRHNLGRTLTETDNIWFTLLTMNTNPSHFDSEYSKNTPFGKPLINSCLTLAIVTGQSVPDVSENAVANLGWDEVRLPNPLFVGDTLYAESEVLETRESKSRPNAGIVTIRTRGYNQHGDIVIEFKRTVMVYRRGMSPKVNLHPAARHDQPSA